MPYQLTNNQGGVTSTAPKSLFTLGMTYSSTGTVNGFCGIYSNAVGPTETLVDATFDYAFTVKRFRITVSSNAKTGNVPMSFRDDGADVTGTALTITASTAGEFDSGAISVDVAAGSKINFKLDASSGTGSITLYAFVECEAVLI